MVDVPDGKPPRRQASSLTVNLSVSEISPRSMSSKTTKAVIILVIDAGVINSSPRLEYRICPVSWSMITAYSAGVSII